LVRRYSALLKAAAARSAPTLIEIDEAVVMGGL